jgi:hypothetical protein
MSRVRNPLAGAGDNCPNCGASLAPDQRYCLACGQRRGDPRLPFMDAVVFMDSVKQPAGGASTAASGATTSPPADRQPFMSANASLVAGVATLVLAIGVGVLIGRTGDSGSSNAANQTPQIIKLGGGGEVEAAGTAQEGGGGAKAGAGKGSGKPKSASQKKAEEKTATTNTGATKATEEAYPVNPNVNLAKPEQQLGGECEPGEAGCGKNGKFEGTFFE